MVPLLPQTRILDTRNALWVLRKPFKHTQHALPSIVLRLSSASQASLHIILPSNSNLSEYLPTPISIPIPWNHSSLGIYTCSLCLRCPGREHGSTIAPAHVSQPLLYDTPASKSHPQAQLPTEHFANSPQQKCFHRGGLDMLLHLQMVSQRWCNLSNND